MFDADTSLANVNILLGLHPEYTLEHLYRGRRIFVKFYSGSSWRRRCAWRGRVYRMFGVGPTTAAYTGECHRISGLDYDYLIIDTAAGISSNVLHFVASSTNGNGGDHPEPTSLTDAFSLLKVMKRKGYKRCIYVTVNMVSDAKKGEDDFGRFQGAVKKYLDLDIVFLATIGLDESVRNAVTLQKPVTLEPPSHPVSGHFFSWLRCCINGFNRIGCPEHPLHAIGKN